MKKLLVVLSFLLAALWFSEACLGGGGSRRRTSTPTTPRPTQSTSDKIARVADKYIGRTTWSVASSHRTGSNTNKCNIFVAEVIEEAGGSVPHRHWWSWSPIGAGEWGNANSSYLKNSGCWRTVTSPRNGDVAGDGVHVAIVTGPSTTTSAASTMVVKNNWGFDRTNPSRVARVFWRFTC